MSNPTLYPVPRIDQAELIAAVGVLCGESNWAPKAKLDTPKVRAWFRRELWPLLTKARFQLHLTINGGLSYSGEMTLPELAVIIQFQDIIIGHLSKSRPCRG